MLCLWQGSPHNCEVAHVSWLLFWIGLHPNCLVEYFLVGDKQLFRENFCFTG